MLRFIQRHAEKITGMLNGLDRIRLRGTFRWLANVEGMESYLYQAGVLLKDFKAYVLATTQHGGINGQFRGEVVSDLKRRPEGIRIKHRLNRNTIKMYDKQGSVLRVETTINDARDMKVFRPKEGQPRGKKSWRPLRKGIADLHRRVQISQAANERYLESMATVEDTVSLEELSRQLCQPAALDGRRVRALNPFSLDDAKLLAAVNRGEFLLNGFRNRDLRPLLFGLAEVSSQETRRQASAVTRKLRLLRAHGLIRKVPKTHRYMLTDKGQSAIAALLAARQADSAKLAQLAA